MDKVQIILLNGPTCAGKTTIARLIQDKSTAPWSVMQIDTFVSMLPQRYRTAPCPADRPAVIARLRHGFHASIAAMAAQGNRLVVDTIRAEPCWLDEWLEVFKPFTVLYVGVFADLEDLERREAQRQRWDDAPGTAKRHFLTVHRENVYDVRLDTSRQSCEGCADTVIEFLQSGHTPNAFAQLRNGRRSENEE